MRQLIDLECPDCGKRTERYISESQVPCICGKTMYKLIGMPRVSLEGCSGDFPSAHSRWADIREQNRDITAKRKASHGD